MPGSPPSILQSPAGNSQAPVLPITLPDDEVLEVVVLASWGTEQGREGRRHIWRLASTLPQLESRPLRDSVFVSSYLQCLD